MIVDLSTPTISAISVFVRCARTNAEISYLCLSDKCFILSDIVVIDGKDSKLFRRRQALKLVSFFLNAYYSITFYISCINNLNSSEICRFSFRESTDSQEVKCCKAHGKDARSRPGMTEREGGQDQAGRSGQPRFGAGFE